MILLCSICKRSLVFEEKFGYAPAESEFLYDFLPQIGFQQDLQLLYTLVPPPLLPLSLVGCVLQIEKQFESYLNWFYRPDY